MRPCSFSLNGKSCSVATGWPWKSITRILPLKLEAQTFSRVTAVPQPIPLIPAPRNPVTGGESVAPSGPNFATPPPMPFTALDCEPGIQFEPLQRLPSASSITRPGA